ncbi:Mut7-C ubiquitin/RNAse domain-containing protein [Geodermatophilus sp. YIM 151500]|uniref:Mut7-C ubiquitin/RNAse domain-containing protein n=1 Tax=Geodermatophilus sp. YIM 151500 TaxID=2984531 RepID=UPI0021E42FB4|nr:Mut7-C ubiquitin/RNAse domain-containing protein [Geodermatophilus sp. YIM 151500]MCV2491187.1 Mut7-C ubiquitin/RNAse domain-containing protein [Geodermatophilus sp. YIM 151500]
MTDTGDVLVRVAGPLAFLLPGRDRAGRVRRLAHDPDATVGHVVQAAGVPLTEAGELRVDGAAAGPDDRPGPGAVVDVGTAPRPEPTPPGGFLLDVGLGALTRRLRLLGQDAAWSADADDPDLVATAVAERRVLLTQDRRLLMRRAFGRDGTARGALVRGSGTEAQLADVLDRFAPSLAPLTRCTACGGPLVDVAKEEVADRLEPGTRRTYERFSRCRSCGRVYWRGAHARRIDALVEAAARAVR